MVRVSIKVRFKVRLAVRLSDFRSIEPSIHNLFGDITALLSFIVNSKLAYFSGPVLQSNY